MASIEASAPLAVVVVMLAVGPVTGRPPSLSCGPPCERKKTPLLKNCCTKIGGCSNPALFSGPIPLRYSVLLTVFSIL